MATSTSPALGSSVPSRRLSSVVLPGAVGAGDRDPVAAVEREVEVLEHAGVDAAQRRDARAAVGGGVELEAHRRRPRAGARPRSPSAISRSRRPSRAFAFFATFFA